MFHFQLGPEFRAGAARFAQPLTQRFSQGFLAGARSVVIGGVAGWAAVVLAGAVLMANVSHETPAPVAASAAAPTPAPPPVAKSEAPPAVAAEPAPPPAPTKTTQRVDMTPTAAIPAEPLAKPRRKPHRKKPKDLDSHT